jgi:hypothetical protein
MDCAVAAVWPSTAQLCTLRNHSHLRDLTRMRASLSQESSRISSRIQKVLEDANIKLASVATNPIDRRESAQEFRRAWALSPLFGIAHLSPTLQYLSAVDLSIPTRGSLPRVECVFHFMQKF